MPRDRRVIVADQGEAFGGNAGQVEIDRLEGQNHDQNRNAEHADTRNGVGHGDGTQTAENGIGRTDQRERNGKGEDRPVDAEHGFQEQRARVEHDRQEDDDIAGKEQEGDQGPDVLVVIALSQQLGRRPAIVLVVNRQEDKGENDQAGDGGKLPPGQQQHLVAIHPDQLVGRQVRQRDRAGDQDPAEAAAGEKVLAFIVGACSFFHGGHAPPGQRTNGQGQNQENADLQRIQRKIFCHHDLPGGHGGEFRPVIQGSGRKCRARTFGFRWRGLLCLSRLTAPDWMIRATVRRL